MKREVKLLPKAAADLAAGQLFYEQQSPEVGQYFRNSLTADLRALLISAGVHRKIHGLHRCHSKRFPYAIFYQVEGDAVLVYAVLDSCRNPDDLRERLRGR